MRLSYNRELKRFECFTSYAEWKAGHVQKVKDARFLFTKTPIPCWWTEDAEQASLLISCADETTKQMLSSIAEKRQNSLSASRAEDANIGNLVDDVDIEFYPFQRAGIGYALSRKVVLFGDEPGLGKTIQVLSTVHIKHAYPCLAIVPASLKINWKKEATEHIPELREEGAVRIISGRRKKDQRLLEGRLDPGAMLWIINYDILSSWIPELNKLNIKSVIADESHFLKNKKAQRTKAAFELITGKKIKSKKSSIVTGTGVDQRYLLSGTALVNRPNELLSQLEILGVLDKFGGGWQYLKRYCDAYSEYIWVKDFDPKQNKSVAKQKLIWHTDGASNLNELQRLLREHVMTRHLKDDVLTELPPKRHQAIEIAANGLQYLIDKENQIEALYQSGKLLAQNSENHDSFEEACDKLQKTYQAYFAEMAKLAHEAALAKLPKIIEICMDILAGQEKLAIFAHHHDVEEGLVKAFTEAGIKTVLLTGQETDKQKDAAIEAFQNGDARVFIGGLKCATGYTITRASQAVMAELDWSPGVMDQAADRLHRIGQRDSVLIIYPVLENSLDSRKVGMLMSKRKILKAALDDPLNDFTV